jgi:hypothetical protein
MLTGAVVLGCAGLLTVGSATPVMAARSGDRDVNRMTAQDVGARCRQAGMDRGRGGPAFELTTDVADGATVAPGDEIRVRLTWDPKDWSGDQLDSALACVRVKGGLDSNLSAGESPTANDGAFEYTLRIPANIRPGCDICVEAFLAGLTADDCCPQQVASDRRCFMSGPPVPPPTTPVTQRPTPPPPAPPPAPEPARAPTEVPAQVAGVTVTPPGTPAPASDPAPAAELPRTGAAATRAASAGGGLALSLGGLAFIGGAGRRGRRRRPRA